MSLILPPFPRRSPGQPQWAPPGAVYPVHYRAPVGSVRYRASCPGCSREAWWASHRVRGSEGDGVRVTVSCRCPVPPGGGA